MHSVPGVDPCNSCHSPRPSNVASVCKLDLISTSIKLSLICFLCVRALIFTLHIVSLLSHGCLDADLSLTNGEYF